MQGQRIENKGRRKGRREEANRRGYKRHGGEHSYKFIGRIEGRLHPDKGGLRECCKGSLEAENECRSPLGLVNDRRHRTDIANKGHGIPMNTIPPVRFPISKLRLWIHGVWVGNFPPPLKIRDFQDKLWNLCRAWWMETNRENERGREFSFILMLL